MAPSTRSFCFSRKTETADVNRFSRQRFQSATTIAPLIGSSSYPAISDDALKDEDNVGWVLHLDASSQQPWIERIGWIRFVDRLAESRLVCPGDDQFQAFLADWQTTLITGRVNRRSPYAAPLQSIRDRWFDAQQQPLESECIQAWNHYLNALHRYHVPHLVIPTYEDYEQMLTDLAGAFFQILPFLSDEQRPAACQFGMVDQFFNHLRDLQEDTLQGICYFPTELLNRFGLSRQEILDQRAPANPNYSRMMEFWLDRYLPRLWHNIWPLSTAANLHPSWQILCRWSIDRYHRIECVFRSCQFDYTCFAQVYWQQVNKDLPRLLAQVNPAG